MDQNKNTNEHDSTETGDKVTQPLVQVPTREAPIPLFLRDGPDGRKNDPQDEKDKSIE